MSEMPRFTLLSLSPQMTRALAQPLAAALSGGDAVLLHGPVGAGKSLFARAVVQALCGADTEVPSPTFTLVQPYLSAAGLPLVHADLYRLGDVSELAELGLDFEDPESATLIEWPDRLGALTPHDALHVTLALAGDEAREITFESEHPRWAALLQAYEKTSQNA